MSVATLQHYIRTYDDDLDAALCERMVESFHALERFQQPNGRGVRPGLEHSAWTELNVTRLADTGFLGIFRLGIDRALERYNQDLGLAIPVPNSSTTADLVIKRYRPGTGEQFELHFDSIYQKSDRYLVMIWYLNDVAAGGETLFPQLEVAVQPKRGRLLMFPPFWMYQHEGRPPVGSDKYIVSTYLTY